MKKRILSFALVLLFCFSMIGTVDLTGEHSHVHADDGTGTYETLSVVPGMTTDTSITIYAVSDKYIVKLYKGTDEIADSVTGPNISHPNHDGIKYTTFSGLESGTEYKLVLILAADNTQKSETTVSTLNPASGQPSAPEIMSRSSHAIKIKTIKGYQYAISESETPGAWGATQTSDGTYIFSGLTAGKTYYIFARVAKGASMESPASAPARVETVKVPTDATFVSITNNSFTINVVEGVLYSIDGSNYSAVTTFNATPGAAVTLYSKYAATATSAEGDVHTQIVMLPLVTASTSVMKNIYGNDNIRLTFSFNPGTFALKDVRFDGSVTYTFAGTSQTIKIENTDSTPINFPANMSSSYYFDTTLDPTTTGAKYSIKITATVCDKSGTVLFTATDAALEGTHTHDFTYSPATCTSPAKCSCGATSGNALGHQWSAATCQSPKKCTRTGCGATEGTADPNAHVDKNNDGKCDLCGTTICVHNWSPANASCTQAQTCTKCGATKAATGHTFEAATCTSPKKCTVCGEKEGNALGHNPNSSNVCTRCSKQLVNHDYNYHKTCSYCKKCLNALCVAYIGCDGTASGCNGSSSGKVAHTGGHALCSKCGNCLVADCEEYKGCTSAKCANSSYGGTIEHNATHDILYGKCSKCGSCLLSECKNYRGCNGQRCLNQGGDSGHLSTHATCSVCGSCLVSTCPLYKGCTSTDCNNRPDPSACSHEWEVVKYEIVPCSEEAKEWGGGSGTFRCKKCLKEEVRAVAASDHTYGERERLANGTWVQKCTMCGKIQVCTDQTCGHNFNTYFVLQRTSSTDCTVGGEWTYICTYPNCGFTVTRTVSAGAHKFDNGVITTPVTDTTPGVKTYTCTVCGKTKTETIPATNPCAGGHTYGDWVVTKTATCTTAGSRTRTCSVCHNTDTEGIAATGHSFSEYVVVKNSTCKEAGYRVCSCIKCGTEKREDLPLADHKMVLVSSKEATCVADGSTIYECSVCGTRKETTTPATGKHSFIDDGENAKKCVACGFRYEIVNDGNKKLIKLSDGNVSLTIAGSDADTYFYSVSEKAASDYGWFDSWMEFLKNKGEVSSDAALIKAYAVEMTNAGEKVALDNYMSATIVLPEENKKTSVKVYTIKGNAPVEITDFKRSGNKITVSGDSLNDSTGEFFVISAKTAKKSNPAVAIVIGIVAVVAVAGVGGYFLYKKGFFSSAE